MASKLLSEVNRMAPYAGYSDVADLTTEDIEKYLKTLVYLRVCKVNETFNETTKLYKSLAKYVEIPVLAYQLLISIGKAYDADYNLEFYPAYNITQDEVLGVAEMEALSSLFRQFTSSGLKTVKGMPNAIDGELDFMAMCHVEDEVVSYRKGHPVFGFLAAFFRQSKLNSVTGLLCRVLYGYETDYKYQIDALFNAIDG
jgi:hypothetical protein